MGTLNNFSLELTCPECGKKTKQEIGRLKNRNTFTFPCCGFTCGTKQFAEGIASAEKTLDRFRSNLRNMGKKS